MMLSIDQVKPDPNQPRRTFNEEKMKALEASMKDNGFRIQYPIIINGGNIIVDGERRWRAAKVVGIKEVPVEVKKDVTPAQRLLYQLQSEGAELDFIERNKAWARLWELSEGFETKRSLSKKLGVNEDMFSRTLLRHEDYQNALKKLGGNIGAAPTSYDTLAELGNEDKDFIQKAVKEKWGRDKTREIKKAIQEWPLRRKQILSQDYSDPYEGSSQWKLRLEVAKSDVDIKELKEIDDTRQHMEGQVDAYTRIMEYGMKLKAALREFDFRAVTPQTRVRLHQGLTKFALVPQDYITDLEGYMIERGELDKTDIKKLH